MQELIKDFTPFFADGNYMIPRKDIQEQVGYLLSLLNTHNLIQEGGIQLYIDKKAYEAIEVGTEDQKEIPDHKTVANFMGTTLSHMSEEAFGSDKEVLDLADKLQNFDPDDADNAKILEGAWNENAELMQNLIYLYSEYIYRVFMQNPLTTSTSIS